ncbi:hypothetical protein IWX81_001064 [Salinibacterium sp. CAN_S4]|uniref:hypothetical protein n=1 Tax=Salinibacterium sp. CAN_S4 TaxID=2787727 RepID=UPI0018EFC426
MTDTENTTDSDADTASGGAPEEPDHSTVGQGGTTKDASDDNGTPVENPAG